MPVDFDFGGITHHESLQSPGLLVQTRKPDQLAFDIFPVRQRIYQEAVVAIDGCNQLAFATLSYPLPITGRNGQTPFGVQSDFGCPSKHGIFDENCARFYRENSALTHLLPLFSTFQHYIDGVLQRQPGFQLIHVVQGLRGYLVAESGRIVAGPRDTKSMSYDDILTI